MSLFRIAWRSIQQRGLASGLTAFTMALGVMLVVAVLLVMGVVAESFQTNSSLGYNMIVGAKGGKLQLVLNTVYYLSTPVENIPYSFYAEFLKREIRGDARDGRYAARTKFAIPLCLGDYFQEYRVIGTTPLMFQDYVYDANRGKKYEFREGRNFKIYSDDYGYFEAVVGHKVARECGLKVGDEFSPTHGEKGAVHESFFVVGILEPTGTPNDRAVFVNMEGFYLLENHAKDPVPAAPGEPSRPAELPPEVVQALADASDTPPRRLDPARQGLKPLPVSQREVTAILLRTQNSLMTLGMTNEINEGSVAQVVLPIREITMLFKTFVEPLQAFLLFLTLLICFISGVSILVSIYNSMSDRKHDIAVMRALGASRNTVMVVVLLESVLLALGGGFLGWLLGHLLVGGALRGVIEDAFGVSIGIARLAPPVDVVAALGFSTTIPMRVSPELLLVPFLILLSIGVGVIPAVAAYRTDVAKSLSSSV